MHFCIFSQPKSDLFVKMIQYAPANNTEIIVTY